MLGYPEIFDVVNKKNKETYFIRTVEYKYRNREGTGRYKVPYGIVPHKLRQKHKIYSSIIQSLLHHDWLGHLSCYLLMSHVWVFLKLQPWDMLWFVRCTISHLSYALIRQFYNLLFILYSDSSSSPFVIYVFHELQMKKIWWRKYWRTFRFHSNITFRERIGHFFKTTVNINCCQSWLVMII